MYNQFILLYDLVIRQDIFTNRKIEKFPVRIEIPTKKDGAFNTALLSFDYSAAVSVSATVSTSVETSVEASAASVITALSRRKSRTSMVRR